MEDQANREIEECKRELEECKKKLDPSQFESEASKPSLQEIKTEILQFNRRLHLLRHRVNMLRDHVYQDVQGDVVFLQTDNFYVRVELLDVHTLSNRNKKKLEKKLNRENEEKMFFGNDYREEIEISDEYKKKLDKSILEMEATVKIMKDMAGEVKLSGVKLNVEMPVVGFESSSFLITSIAAAAAACFFYWQLS